MWEYPMFLRLLPSGLTSTILSNVLSVTQNLASPWSLLFPGALVYLSLCMTVQLYRSRYGVRNSSAFYCSFQILFFHWFNLRVSCSRNVMSPCTEATCKATLKTHTVLCSQFPLASLHTTDILHPVVQSCWVLILSPLFTVLHIFSHIWLGVS